MPLDPQVDALLGQLAETRMPSPESMTVARNRDMIGMIHGFFQMGGVLDASREVMDRAGAAAREALA